jgi:hypothetical protein
MGRKLLAMHMGNAAVVSCIAGGACFSLVGAGGACSALVVADSGMGPVRDYKDEEGVWHKTGICYLKGADMSACDIPNSNYAD